MKTLQNKTYKLKTTILQQDSNTQELRVIYTGKDMTLSTLLEPNLRELNPQILADLKLLRERQIAIDAIEGLSPNETIEVEDSVMETIIKAGKDFKCAFVCKEFIEFKEYIEELEKQPSKKPSTLKTNNK